MKKLFYLTVMLAAMLWSCDKNEEELDVENGEGVITMVAETNEVDLYIESFNEGETITIDWGNGIKEEFKTIATDEDDTEFYFCCEPEHHYPNSNPHTITIRGYIKYLECGYGLTSLDVSKCTALEGLYCNGNDLKSLDVSKCKALDWLDCSNNNLTSLDVSGCTALTKLWCFDNNLSATALNRIFNDLPKGKTWIDDGYEWQSYIITYNNPGSKTCDTSIAENKGWRVNNF